MDPSGYSQSELADFIRAESNPRFAAAAEHLAQNIIEGKARTDFLRNAYFLASFHKWEIDGKKAVDRLNTLYLAARGMNFMDSGQAEFYQSLVAEINMTRSIQKEVVSYMFEKILSENIPQEPLIRLDEFGKYWYYFPENIRILESGLSPDRLDLSYVRNSFAAAFQDAISSDLKYKKITMSSIGPLTADKEKIGLEETINASISLGDLPIEIKLLESSPYFREISRQKIMDSIEELCIKNSWGISKDSSSYAVSVAPGKNICIEVSADDFDITDENQYFKLQSNADSLKIIFCSDVLTNFRHPSNIFRTLSRYLQGSYFIFGGFNGTKNRDNYKRYTPISEAFLKRIGIPNDSLDLFKENDFFSGSQSSSIEMVQGGRRLMVSTIYKDQLTIREVTTGSYGDGSIEKAVRLREDLMMKDVYTGEQYLIGPVRLSAPIDADYAEMNQYTSRIPVAFAKGTHIVTCFSGIFHPVTLQNLLKDTLNWDPVEFFPSEKEKQQDRVIYSVWKLPYIIAPDRREYVHKPVVSDQVTK